MPVMGSLLGQTHGAKVSAEPPLLKATYTEKMDTQGHFVLDLRGSSFHYTSLYLLFYFLSYIYIYI